MATFDSFGTSVQRKITTPNTPSCAYFISKSTSREHPEILVVVHGSRSSTWLVVLRYDGKALVQTKKVEVSAQITSSAVLNPDQTMIGLCFLHGSKAVVKLSDLSVVVGAKAVHDMPAGSCCFVEEGALVSGSGDYTFHVLGAAPGGVRPRGGGFWRAVALALLLPLRVWLVTCVLGLSTVMFKDGMGLQVNDSRTICTTGFVKFSGT
jgi:hypothetical protein